MVFRLVCKTRAIKWNRLLRRTLNIAIASGEHLMRPVNELMEILPRCRPNLHI
jgi:hypothetical protein